MCNLPPKLGALFFCLVVVCSMSAQSRQIKWEIEVHGSGFLKDDANGGVKNLPGLGPSFATVLANTDSRQVSSFLFGDGNKLINQVLVGQGLAPIPSLDGSILQNRLALERQSNVGLGFRVSRYFGEKYWLDWTNEYDIDYDHGSFEINEMEDADSDIPLKVWVTSLESLFANCGASCPFAVAAVKHSTREKGHAATTAVTFNRDLPAVRGFVPYIGVGGGLVFSVAGTPSQDYFGHYVLANGAIQGSDHVRVSFQVPGVAPALVIAAGAKYQLSKHWGLRMEMRNNFEPHSFKTVVQAFPEFTDGGAGNVIALSGGGSAVQFSDNQSLALTTLSLQQPQFRTFKSIGFRYEGRISGGAYYRF
jgi:hypothetical protein